MEAFCLKCGGALRRRPRMDNEIVDDVSPRWLATLQQLGSPKIRAGRYVVAENKFSPADKLLSFVRPESSEHPTQNRHAWTPHRSGASSFAHRPPAQSQNRAKFLLAFNPALSRIWPCLKAYICRSV